MFQTDEVGTLQDGRSNIGCQASSFLSFGCADVNEELVSVFVVVERRSLDPENLDSLSCYSCPLKVRFHFGRFHLPVAKVLALFKLASDVLWRKES
jgi:hypothetical protein